MDSLGYDDGITAMKRGGQMRLSKKFDIGGYEEVQQIPVDESYIYDANGQIAGLGSDYYIRQYWNRHPDEYLKLYGADSVGQQQGFDWSQVDQKGLMKGMSQFGSTMSSFGKQDPSLGKNINMSTPWSAIAGTAGSLTVDALRGIDSAIRQWDRHDYSPMKAVGLARGGRKFDGGGFTSGIMDKVNSGAKILSNALYQTQLTTDYDTFADAVNRYKQDQLKSLDDISDNSALLAADANRQILTGNLTGRNFRDKTVLSDFADGLASSFEGFNATGNWIGAVLGGVSSNLGSIYGRVRAFNAAEKGNGLVADVNHAIQNKFYNTGKRVDFLNDAKKEQMTFDDPFNYNAYGGELRTHGLDFNNGFTFINEGGTHEQNPLEGVPSGVDENGVPNLVEEGEVIWNNEYVFSNRIKIPKHLADKYRLDTSMTFADAIKEVTKESLTRPNDPISNETNKALVNEFMDEQEAIRGKEQAKAKAELQKAYDDDFANQLAALTEGQAPAPAMGMQLGMPQGGMEGAPVEGEPVLSAFGGRKFLKGSYKPGLSGTPVKDLEDVYDSGNGVFYDAKTGAYYNSLDEIRLLRGMEVERFDQINPVTVTADKKVVVPQPKAEDKPVAQAKVDTKAAEVKPKGERDIKDLNATKHDDVIPFQYRPTWQRYAPVYGAGAMALYGMANRPNYENADAIIAAARQAGVPVNIPVETIGDFMTFKPFDERYLVNMANQNRAAAARGIVNTANGNRAMDLLGNMALAHSSQQELGEIMRQAYLANQTERARVADFNRATRLHNMSAINQRNLSQAQLNSQRQATALSGLAQGYGMRQNIRDAWDNNTMESLNSFLESLGAIGKENEEYNMMTSMAEHGYFPYYWGDNGTMQFAPAQQQPVVAQQAPVQVVQQVPIQRWQPDPNWKVNYQWQINAKGGVKKNKKRRF